MRPTHGVGASLLPLELPGALRSVRRAFEGRWVVLDVAEGGYSTFPDLGSDLSPKLADADRSEAPPGSPESVDGLKRALALAGGDEREAALAAPPPDPVDDDQPSPILPRPTGRPVEIIGPTRDALTAWLALRGRRVDDRLFPSRSRPGDHLSTRRYARLVDRWVAMTDLEPRAYGTHSLRRTKVALVYKKTGILADHVHLRADG